ncbi:hypothetical protein [Falsiroseomonas ponticola]|uniref:hypothetical protein n=1 Tax=Falsiroseomonas ponticola TaxID=2786951 RepID=UPI00193392AD|nr:hypothetical protein [Roseomonas ponticola]
MTTISSKLTLAAALFGTALAFGAATAQAADAPSYPRSVGTGENSEIVYAPGYQGNVVGGGRVVTQQMPGHEVAVTYLDDNYAQHQAPGVVSQSVSNGENTDFVLAPLSAPRG